MPHVRGLERRRRDEREQPRHLRQHLGRRLQRRLDLGARRREIEREGGRLRLELAEQLVGVVAVTALGRHASRRRVRMREQAEVLELRELGADRRRRDAQVGALDERLRADRLPGADELLDDAAENRLLPLAQLHRFLHLQEILAAAQATISAVTPPPRKRPRRVSASVSPASTARPSCSARARPSASRAERSPPTRQRLVEPEAEHHAFARPRLVVQELDLAVVVPLEVAGELRRVAAALVAERRHGADAEAEIVVAEPVAEVVLGALAVPAEVGGLVPAVPGGGEGRRRRARSSPPSARPAARARRRARS